MEMNLANSEHEETQFCTIREFMLAVSMRGEWLTLSEIAAQTEYGEASISAQLRHLRKPQFGGYRVEKRRRHSSAFTSDASVTHDASITFDASIRHENSSWEYFVRHPQRMECGVFEVEISRGTPSVNKQAPQNSLASSSDGTSAMEQQSREQQRGAKVVQEVCHR
jgi:hypothetical protein